MVMAIEMGLRQTIGETVKIRAKGVGWRMGSTMGKRAGSTRGLNGTVAIEEEPNYKYRVVASRTPGVHLIGGEALDFLLAQGRPLLSAHSGCWEE